MGEKSISLQSVSVYLISHMLQVLSDAGEKITQVIRTGPLRWSETLQSLYPSEASYPEQSWVRLLSGLLCGSRRDGQVL